MAYKFTIHTDKFRKVLGRNPDTLVLNYVMDKMDGLSYREANYEELGWRLLYFFEGSIYPFDPRFRGPKPVFYWLDKHKVKNYIEIPPAVAVRETHSPNHPVCLPAYPEKATEFYSVNWVKEALRKDGVCKIPFKVFWREELGYYNGFDDCYIEITKC